MSEELEVAISGGWFKRDMELEREREGGGQLTSRFTLIDSDEEIDELLAGIAGMRSCVVRHVCHCHSATVSTDRQQGLSCTQYTYHRLTASVSLSISTAIFPGEPGLAGFTAAKDDGSDGDNWSCKTCTAPVKSSPQTNQHPTFYRPYALPVNGDKALAFV